MRPRRRGPLLATLLSLTLLAAACADDAAETAADVGSETEATASVDDDDDETADDETEATASVDDDDDGTVEQGGETAPSAPIDADVVVMATVTAGGVEIDDRRIEVGLGQTVGIVVDSHEEDLVHVHGYDLLADVRPGSPAEITFTADSPGVFEIELENSGRFLFELEVSNG